MLHYTISAFIFSQIIMSIPLTCTELACERGNGCCRSYTDSSNQVVNYCQISSICKDDPIWQAIVIPAVLFLLAVILLIIACVKLRSSRKQTMRVHNFARKEIRVEPRPSERRFSTLTSVY